MIFSWLELLIFLQFIYTSAALIPLVTTLAGRTPYGNANGEGTNARFYIPQRGDISPDGTIYILADSGNQLIRKITISTSTVSTLAGKASGTGVTNGEGTNALFNNPSSIVYSPDGSYALITDFSNNLIRKIIISTAQVTKIAGGGSSGTSSGSVNGAGTNALFNQPDAITISPDGLTAMVADTSNNMIRKIIISTFVVSTLAGQTTAGSTNGIGTLAKFFSPTGIDYYPDGTAIIVADRDNYLIRKIILSTFRVFTLAGAATTAGSTNGVGTNSRFNYPYDIRISPSGSYALVADRNNHMVRSIFLTTLFVDIVTGTTTFGTANGVGTNAQLNYPRGVAISPYGEFFLISDTYNQMIRYAYILDQPTRKPSLSPTHAPTRFPSAFPTLRPSFIPSNSPTRKPSLSPTHAPTRLPSAPPTLHPSFIPSNSPTRMPSLSPTHAPTQFPSESPTLRPSCIPSNSPTFTPSISPTLAPTQFPSTSPTLRPSCIPSNSPTFTPSISPTLIPPSSVPSSQPSSSPSISFQPTATCPPGHIRDINNEEDPTSCMSCEEGYYSDGGNENSCHACAPLTWNAGSGNTDCEYTTIRNSASDAYPITFCVFYALLSMICFGLTLALGGSCTMFLNILLITTDQISDILYFWYSLFANPSLLYLSIAFCIANLLFPMMYLLWHLSFENLLATQWLNLLSDLYYQYDLANGKYEENEHPKYDGWIFHSIRGWSIGEFFPFSLIYYVVDLIWIIIRILIMILIVISSIIFQVLLLLIGVVLCASKLMSIPVVGIWFWGQWNPTYLKTYSQITTGDSPVVYNTLVLLEVCSECVPQIIIQITNSILMSERWTPLAIFSVIMSGFMIISVFHHFWYKHRKLLRKGDPTYTSFDFARIPKYDLYEKFLTSCTNPRDDYKPPPTSGPTGTTEVDIEIAVSNAQDISVIKNEERNL